jgi:hypothetical protein
MVGCIVLSARAAESRPALHVFTGWFGGRHAEVLRDT